MNMKKESTKQSRLHSETNIDEFYQKFYDLTVESKAVVSKPIIRYNITEPLKGHSLSNI